MYVKDGISSLTKRGCAVGLLWTTGLQGLGNTCLCGQMIGEGGSLSLLGISSGEQELWFDSSCCGRVDPQISLLSQLLSITLILVKVVTSLYLHCLGAVTKQEVPPVRAAGLSYCDPQKQRITENPCLVLGSTLNWWWAVRACNSRGLIQPKFYYFFVV